MLEVVGLEMVMLVVELTQEGLAVVGQAVQDMERQPRQQEHQTQAAAVAAGLLEHHQQRVALAVQA